jgi:acetylornithine/N-succinyldiaminopimelate aminotransferase
MSSQESMNQSSIAAMSPLMATYNRFPLTLVKGKGSYVWDDQGEKYLDFTSGIATCNLGHVPDAVKEKIEGQLENLWHCSNLYHIPTQEKLASLLVQHSCADQAFFCNSGTEANEAAIKLARRYSQKVKGREAFEIVTFKQSFHGRTLGALAATGQEKLQEGFQPLISGFRYLPYNDLDALGELVSSKTCAVLLELVQGEGGVIPADSEWLQQLALLCQKHDLLLMVDEIQTGMGRTGTLFSYEQYGIEPDVITVAKGLGSGFPIGAVLAKKDAAAAFDAGSHGSTFGGNPLATTAGMATIEVLMNGDVLQHSRQMGEYLNDRLRKCQERYTEIEEVRGKGLLQGILIKGRAAQVVQSAREKNVLILLAGPDVVRILPPLTTTEEEIDGFVSVMEQVFSQL